MGTQARIVVSACLLGERVRYDGGHCRAEAILRKMGPSVEWVPLCPEADAGLGVPRETIDLVRAGGTLRLLGTETRTDHTQAMRRWATKRAKALREAGVDGCVLKARSPSCGVGSARVLDGHGAEHAREDGMFARAVREAMPSLPVAEESDLEEPTALREFLEAVLHHARERAGSTSG
ncbi:MAG: DUF523 domain-containing protein [Gemmatimonadota bacterium]|jgi:uncharacterized protein YbbK (DUF523 family)|nr:DUF523 domain-containing protein [Gemmatimonadota bacterium]